MRYLFGFICVLALSVMGCSETSGTGDPFPGNCGAQGQGGGGRYVHPGLYVAYLPDVVLPYQGCVYVNEDCTELEASTKCNIGEDDSQAHFLEVEWTNGRTDTGDDCAARVGVTPDLVTQIPLTGCGEYNCSSFSIEFSDDEGADWEIGGQWSYGDLLVYPSRTTVDGVCRPHFEFDYGVVDNPVTMAFRTASWFPPEVVDFDFNPKQVDVTAAPANVVGEATVTHPNGVDRWNVSFKSPSGGTHSCFVSSPSSGDIYDGVWSCTVTIPQGEEPGRWELIMRAQNTGAALEVVSR
jgi:hypothetical protein